FIKVTTKVENWIEKTSVDGKWPANSKNITQSWLKEGLKPQYLNYENKKFSKSRNIWVFGGDAKDNGIPFVWRYYLISSRPETSGSIFTWKEFIIRNNTEFTIPSFSYDSESEQTLIENINNLLTNYIEALENIKLRAGLEIAMDISRQSNGYLQESKPDNTLFANSLEKCASVIGVSINLIYLLSAVFSQYMPSVTESILRQLNAPLRNIPDTFTMDIEAGHQIGKAEFLSRGLMKKWQKNLTTNNVIATEVPKAD
ncbi:19263_t:CDS:2, partial [Cetraspora pellucida]